MIRIATEKDIPAMLAIYAPYVTNTTYSFEYVPPTQEQFTTRFLKYTAQCPWLVWEEKGRVLGYAYASLPFERAAYAWCAEVSIYLAPEVHGQGIGKQLYALLEEILWRQGYRIIYSLITSENTGSLAFHEKVGYAYCAQFPGCGIKFGRSLGVVWMEKRTNSVDLPIDPPVSWKSIVENDRKLADILASLPLS
jgi:phosphinothricin acetyltransferase